MRIQSTYLGSIDNTAVFGAGYDGNLYALSSDGQVSGISKDGICEYCRLQIQYGQFWHNFQLMPNGYLAGNVTGGLLFDDHGNPQDVIDLGQCIADIQTTKQGQIWVSYFDEGYGMNRHLAGPSTQLRLFDRTSQCVYGYEPPLGEEDIFDCYALNVTSSSEAWCCYYTDFPLVRIENTRPAGVWHPGIDGVSSFAIWRDRALLQAGYGATGWKLFRLSEPIEFLADVEIVTPDGELLVCRDSITRGPVVWHVVKGRHVYRTSLRDLSF